MFALLVMKVKPILTGLFRNIEFIIIAALVIAVFFKGAQVSSLKADIAKERSEVALLKQANEINLNTISILEDWQRKQNDAMLTLQKATDEVKASTNNLRSDIAKLGQSNEQIRDYLHTPIPDDLGRVLNPHP